MHLSKTMQLYNTKCDLSVERFLSNHLGVVRSQDGMLKVKKINLTILQMLQMFLMQMGKNSANVSNFQNEWSVRLKARRNCT